MHGAADPCALSTNNLNPWLQQNLKNKIISKHQSKVNWNELILGNNLEQDCLTFSSKIQEIISKFNRKIKHRAKNNSLHWLNDNIFKLMKSVILL